VIGGGICGAAAAWDAAQRGLSVALVERDDFAGATSSNSLKVVHGGVRYLQHLDVARVRESSRERAALLRIAPHLVKPMPVLVPTFGHGMQGPEVLRAAFLLLNGLTFDRNRRLEHSPIPGARILSRAEAVERCPELVGKDLTGAGLFWDGQFESPPRLVWEMVEAAAHNGAAVANYCGARDLLLRGDRVFGVAVQDYLGKERFDLRARVVINAAGPFAEQLSIRAGLQDARRIPLSRDLALVVSRKPSAPYALALPTRHRDPDAWLSRGPRHLFFMPWRDVTLIGVHSAIFPGDPDALEVGSEEVAYFLDEVNAAAPWLNLAPSDVVMVYAGLLPADAGSGTGESVSFGKRPHLIDHARRDGIQSLVTAMTNRFTTARSVAQRAVDLAGRKLGRPVPPSRTAVTRLAGASSPPESAALETRVIRAVREEMAQTLGDCVFRRTDIASSGHPGDAILGRSAQIMATELGWTALRQQQELEKVRSRLLTFRPGSSAEGY
jgi:glycerol-3-phosphate dehydrogenase